MDEKLRILIEEEEWGDLPKNKRERIKKLLLENYGYDASWLDDKLE